ncbi:MAG: MFS transporter [Clostridia bacterium]|nr:MFS transporter [Clostridia bacterium]
MPSTILLIVIYIAFISLGLPDSLLGTAWPSMRSTLKLPLEAAGIFISITTLSTAISSFVSGHVISRLGTGKVTFISCVLTGSMLLGYSLAPSYLWLLILTIPLGFGAGAVDTGLNNYVAKYFSSRHMSWLHCFWGVGASLGPSIMTLAITQANSWRIGYRVIGFIQLSLSVILLITLPLWKEKETHQEHTEQTKNVHGNVLKNMGVWLSIIAFPLYIGIEAGTGVWLGSLLVEGRGIDQVTAGLWISLFYVSITVGRFLSGLITDKFSNRQMIRGGLIIAIAGAALLTLPVKALILPGIVLIGLGCAPVFPCMIHETPRRFGNAQSEIITGYQVGMAYLSGVAIIPLVGLLAGRVSLETIPACVLVFAVLTLIGTERLNKIT